jgi:hypothetical protein
MVNEQRKVKEGDGSWRVFIEVLEIRRIAVRPHIGVALVVMIDIRIERRREFKNVSPTKKKAYQGQDK